MPFRLRAEAEADVEEIAAHIAADSPAAAIRWYEAVLTQCRRLGDMPGLGVDRSDIRPGLRLFPSGNYLILYRQIGEGVEIVRILHGARRWRPLL